MDKKTMNTVLIVGIGALAVYLLTRPKTSPYALPAVYSGGTALPPSALSQFTAGGATPPGYTAPGNTTASIISASGGAASSLINSLGDIFS